MAGNHTSSSGDKELCSSLDVAAFASLSSVSCGTWWNCLFSPPKFRSVTVPHSQCHSCSENIHQSISWNQTAKHHCNAGQVHRHFSFFFFFFPWAGGRAYPTQNTNPSHQQGGRCRSWANGAVLLLVSGKYHVTSHKPHLNRWHAGQQHVHAHPSFSSGIFPKSLTQEGF